MRSTYFQYNGSIYEQLEGAAMGSPISAVIANPYMESFEQQAITTSAYKPRIWKRYVDDTFTILDRGNVDSFLQQPAAFHSLHHGDREWLQTRFPWHRIFKRTGRRPHHQPIQEAYAHWSVLSVWFPPPAISKTRYCQVPLRARQTSSNKTLCYLQGKEAPVFCSCL